MNEILDQEGKLASGILCLYVTKSGMIFSESARDDGDSFYFETKKTCVITVAIGADGKTRYHIEKAAAQFGGPTYFLVPKTALTMIQDVTDRQLLGNARRILSGLITTN